MRCFDGEDFIIEWWLCGGDDTNKKQQTTIDLFDKPIRGTFEFLMRGGCLYFIDECIVCIQLCFKVFSSDVVVVTTCTSIAATIFWGTQLFYFGSSSSHFYFAIDIVDVVDSQENNNNCVQYFILLNRFGSKLSRKYLILFSEEV